MAIDCFEGEPEETGTVEVDETIELPKVCFNKLISSDQLIN